MVNPFHRFDSIYCINLASRQDRWLKCLKSFSDFDIPNVQRFEGIQVSDPSLSDYSSVQRNRLGCALSFYSIIEKAYNENKQSLLILEDDFWLIYPVAETLENLDKYILSLPLNWDILFLGANLHSSNGFPIEAFSDNLIKVNSSYALHSVSFSRAGMEKFLNSFNDRQDFEDKILNHFGAIDIFFAVEFLRRNNCFIGKKLLAGQHEDISDIEGWYADYTPSLISRFNYFTSLI